MEKSNAQTPQLTAAQNEVDRQWNGYSLDELRMRRAMALVHAQLGKEKLNLLLNGTKERVADNGLRGLLFTDNTINNLRTADYLLLGFKLTNTVFKTWRKIKRK